MAVVDLTNYELWDNIKAKYPDTFVLLENPEFESKYSPVLKRGIFVYKNKNRKKVIENDLGKKNK
ncbi:hypothetical protein AGMMS50262_17430 [Bacteroidia bacterium]|nr:hypothetical protein AGMMS50262_17430 [Bacteroidia bacterium]